MTVTERLLHYVSFDTQSDESSETCPSTAKQKLLGEALVEEMRALGIADARIDADGYVITEGDQVFLGGNDSYIAMCHKCYQDYINEHRKVELLHGTERDPQ